MSDIIHEKRLAAEKAVDLINDGDVVGLGTGSTVHFFLLKLSESIRNGSLKNIVGVATSKNTEQKAVELGIPVSALNSNPVINITVDGADEIDPEFNLIKGGGGALLREKIIAQASKQLVIVADPSKFSERLFQKFRLPVEVFPMALGVEAHYLMGLGAVPEQRVDEKGKTYITDEGNFILDCKFSIESDILEIDRKINSRAGVAEHGLFLNMATKIISMGNGFAKIFENSQELLKLKSAKK